MCYFSNYEAFVFRKKGYKALLYEKNNDDRLAVVEVPFTIC